MSEQITGEQLEASSYDKPNTTAECSECGTAIDVEQDYHGVSIDGEKYCCSYCMENMVKVYCFQMCHQVLWLAAGHVDNVEITVVADSRKQALSELEDWFDGSHRGKLFIERG